MSENSCFRTAVFLYIERKQTHSEPRNAAEREVRMEFFGQAIETLKVMVIALGAGLGVWGIINLLEGYGADNPGANAHMW